MDSVFTRTSVTVDEAVIILLGWTKGPVSYRALTEEVSWEDQEALDSLSFSLREDLADDLDSLRSDLAEAVADGLPNTTIEALREAVQKHRGVIALANTYRCAIEDEINSETSALRVDVSRSSAHFTFITLASLDEWATSKGYGVQVLTPVPTGPPSMVEPATGKNKRKPRRRQRDQEEAIVAEVKRLGHNPRELPTNASGKNGVKSDVWDALQTNDLFTSRGVFDKAWERTKSNKDVVDKKGSKPSSPKKP